MSKARLVITAVVIEGRSQSEVARAYGASQSWISRLVKRYRLEGDAAFIPHSAAASHQPKPPATADHRPDRLGARETRQRAPIFWAAQLCAAEPRRRGAPSPSRRNARLQPPSHPTACRTRSPTVVAIRQIVIANDPDKTPVTNRVEADFGGSFRHRSRSRALRRDSPHSYRCNRTCWTCVSTPPASPLLAYLG